MKREFSFLLAGWLVLAAFIFGMGWQNLSAPGLFYDEAIYGGLTKDFLSGHATGGHMPGTSTISILGGPLPIFVQPYLGALKCWLLIPIFKLFGSTQAVLRGANLFFSASALLIFMVWTWRLLGLVEALLAGLLLALDPAFFFLGVLDWGSLLPSLLFRFAGFFLMLLAWRRQHAGWALAAGFVFGLGFFNKIDFGIILAGTALAAFCTGAKSIVTSVRARPKIILSVLLGFLAGAGPILAIFRVILHTVFSRSAPHNPGEFAEKLNALRAMYDGSYFYRLMDVGGVFDKMYLAPSPVWTPFGIVAIIAALILLADILLFTSQNSQRPLKVFILLSALFITVGALILPGAVRIHHTTMVYPFPHLLIACACVAVWQNRWKSFLFRRTIRLWVILLAGLLAVCSVSAIQRTEQLVRETGGRGWWSNSLMDFAGKYQGRTGLVISSLDWGFNEQLEFLTAGPRLEEPFWQAAFGGQPELPRDAGHLYLVHAPEFSLSPFGTQFMESVTRENTNAVINPWLDRQGKTVFYTITFTNR